MTPRVGRGSRLAVVVTLMACAAGVVGEVACGSASQQTATSSAARGEMPRSVLDPYLKIQLALADDSVDGVRQNAGEIATAATALGAPARAIDTTALQLASATELDDARAKFGALSEAVDGYMKAQKLKAPDGVRAAWCPMAMKPWLQASDTINNPYYGKAMPSCGSFR